MARKLGSPTLSRLGVSRDLESQNRVRKYWTRTSTGGGDESGGTRTGGCIWRLIFGGVYRLGLAVNMW